MNAAIQCRHCGDVFDLGVFEEHCYVLAGRLSTSEIAALFLTVLDARWSE